LLALVDLLVLEVVEALVLRVATHEGHSGFAQVVFMETVTGLNEARVLAFKHT